MWGFAEAIIIMNLAGFWLEPSECDRLETAREASLMSYAHLSRESCDTGILTWPTKPKNHYWDELCRESVRLSQNPSSHWCFQDEDFIGRVVVISRSCDTRCREKRTFEKYLLNLLIMLNNWTKEIPFEDPISDIDSDGMAPDQ